jgi:predicted RNase H-like nuclease
MTREGYRWKGPSGGFGERLERMWVAGVDGCRGGWVVVLLEADTKKVEVRYCATFASILALPEAPLVIAVDMPIGLPQSAGLGGRACDIEARAGLGDRQSSLFAVPSRAAVMEPDYRAACTVALQTSVPPRMVSKQCFNLFPKIREIDALMTPARQKQIMECHPEVAFWAMNGDLPLELPKKVKSRPHPPGLELRRALLQAACQMAALPAVASGMAAGADDILDAASCAVTALAILRGTARRFPTVPPLDAKGLRMEIWAPPQAQRHGV